VPIRGTQAHCRYTLSRRFQRPIAFDSSGQDGAWPRLLSLCIEGLLAGAHIAAPAGGAGAGGEGGASGLLAEVDESFYQVGRGGKKRA
jgi:hypothetical protein